MPGMKYHAERLLPTGGAQDMGARRTADSGAVRDSFDKPLIGAGGHAQGLIN